MTPELLEKRMEVLWSHHLSKDREAEIREWAREVALEVMRKEIFLGGFPLGPTGPAGYSGEKGEKGSPGRYGAEGACTCGTSESEPSGGQGIAPHLRID